MVRNSAKKCHNQSTVYPPYSHQESLFENSLPILKKVSQCFAVFLKITIRVGLTIAYKYEILSTMNKEETFTLKSLDKIIRGYLEHGSPVRPWEEFFKSTLALRSLKGLPETKETAEHPDD